MIELLPASSNDISVIKNICDNARQFQRMLGFEQWLDGYPSIEIIRADIMSGKGRLIIYYGKIIGYCVIDLEGDREYDKALEIWHNSNDAYAAVHRFALSATARGKRLSLPVLRLIEQSIARHGIRVIKVDTGIENTPMQRLLTSAGFSYRGIHTFSWGMRLAYEKEV